MKKLLKVLGLALLLTLGACGSGGSGGIEAGIGGEPYNKRLFSTWYQNEADFTLDLTNASFGTDLNYDVRINGVIKCSSKVRLTGTEESGTFTQHSFVSKNGGQCGININGYDFPLFTEDTIEGNFSKSSTQLTIVIDYMEIYDPTNTLGFSPDSSGYVYLTINSPIVKTYR